MSCGMGRRCGSDLASLWLCCRPAAAAPIWPLAWEPPYAMGAALKKKKKKDHKNNNGSWQWPSMLLKHLTSGSQTSLYITSPGGGAVYEIRWLGSESIESIPFFFCFFRATLVVYGGSQARGQIRAAAARHSHSHTRSKLRMRPTPQLTATSDP